MPMTIKILTPYVHFLFYLNLLLIVLFYTNTGYNCGMDGSDRAKGERGGEKTRITTSGNVCCCCCRYFNRYHHAHTVVSPLFLVYYTTYVRTHFRML